MDIFGTGLVPLVPSKIGLSGGDIDKPVKIVYLLTIAGRASRQVRRLVKQIYSPEHYIFVHVDSRYLSIYEYLLKMLKTLLQAGVHVPRDGGAQ